MAVVVGPARRYVLDVDQPRMAHMIPIPVLKSTVEGDRLELAASGAWTAVNADELERLVDAAAPQVAGAQRILLDMAGVEALDTIGAWLLERLIRNSNLNGKRAQFTGLSPRHRGLIDEMHAVNLEPRTHLRVASPLTTALEAVGRAAVRLWADVMDFLAMFGDLSVALARIARHPRRFRLRA